MNRSAIPHDLTLAAPHSASSSAIRPVLVVAASAFVAICAHVTVPLPFTPVPVVLSDFAVLVVGLTLGPWSAFAALALYLGEGAAGLPVFSPLGPGGIAQLFGPTAGYLLAYPFAAALAALVRHGAKQALGVMMAKTLGACLAAGLILASGMGWLMHWMHLSLAAGWRLAILPFLLGAALKVVTSVAVSMAGRGPHKT